MADEDEGEDDDIVCVHCLSGDASEGNDILFREGAHSTTVGWHQLCLTPPLHEVPHGCWLCLECVFAWCGPGSRLADLDYTPSRASAEASAASGSTSNSNSDSSSNSDSATSSDFDSVSVSDFDSDSTLTVTLTKHTPGKARHGGTQSAEETKVAPPRLRWTGCHSRGNDYTGSAI